jgi:hypothetical protein
MSESWPDSAGTSIGKLLTTLRAVGQPAGTTDTPSPLKTPYSLQDIKSGATALTKLWAVAVAAAGGAPAIWAIIEGLANSVGGSKSDVPLVRAAFVISGAVLLSAVSIAIAIIVRGDVAARATAHAARRSAEGAIVSSVLANYRFALPSGWLVKKTDGTYLKIDQLNWAGGNLVITAGNEILQPDQWNAIIDCRDIGPDKT